MDDVRRASAENEQPVVFGGVEAEELLDAGFAHGDQRQDGPDDEHVFQVLVFVHRELGEHHDKEEVERHGPHGREPSRNRNRFGVDHFEHAVRHPDRRDDGQPGAGAFPFDAVHHGLQAYYQDVVEYQRIEDHAERQVVGVTGQPHDEVIDHEQSEHRQRRIAQRDPQDAECGGNGGDDGPGEQSVVEESHGDHGHAADEHAPDDEPGDADGCGYAAVAFHSGLFLRRITGCAFI